MTALAGCGGRGGPGGGSEDGEVPEGSIEVIVGEDGPPHFDPQTVQITVGQTVTWIAAEGTEDHQVRARETPEESTWAGITTQFIANGDTYSHTFEVPGTYVYSCSPYHAGNEGTVEVTE